MTAGERDWRRRWRAYEALLSATLAYSRYLQAQGRLRDPASGVEIATLEAELGSLRRRLARAGPAGERVIPLPRDPAALMAQASRRQLRRYRDAVCADARRLRAASAVLKRRLRETRLSRAQERQVS